MFEDRKEIVEGTAKILSWWETSDLLFAETAEEIVDFCLGSKSLAEVICNLERKSHEVL
jgi:hypothetical protein